MSDAVEPSASVNNQRKTQRIKAMPTTSANSKYQNFQLFNKQPSAPSEVSATSSRSTTSSALFSDKRSAQSEAGTACTSDSGMTDAHNPADGRQSEASVGANRTAQVKAANAKQEDKDAVLLQAARRGPLAFQSDAFSDLDLDNLPPSSPPVLPAHLTALSDAESPSLADSTADTPGGMQINGVTWSEEAVAFLASALAVQQQQLSPDGEPRPMNMSGDGLGMDLGDRTLQDLFASMSNNFSPAASGTDGVSPPAGQAVNVHPVKDVDANVAMDIWTEGMSAQLQIRRRIAEQDLPQRSQLISDYQQRQVLKGLTMTRRRSLMAYLVKRNKSNGDFNVKADSNNFAHSSAPRVVRTRLLRFCAVLRSLKR